MKKQIIRFLKTTLGKFRIIKFLFYEYFSLSKNLGSINMVGSQHKLRANIILLGHIIEKGLSLKDVRVGFGKERMLLLLNNLDLYYKKYGDNEFLEYSLTIVDVYLEFNRKNGIEDTDIIKLYNKLNQFRNTQNFDNICGGVLSISKDEIYKYAKVPYFDFVKSRHSIRNFTGEKVDEELINNALKIAEYTPSACNRQPWKNHVFISKNKIIELLDFQTGARQFKDDISCVILVTSSHSSFFGYELHQAYVNGGMYAMNLLFALHSQGLGTIPLNMGLESSKLKKLKTICDIDKDEEPIMLIAVGAIPDKLNVAISQRFDYKKYTKYY